MEDAQSVCPSDSNEPVILVVDDDAVVLNSIGRMLHSEGYRILWASDGAEALAISRDFKGTIDAVLSDVKMPNVDGLELRERISGERPGIKVILMSGYIQCLPEGVPLVTKPFGAEILRRRIREVLGLTPARRSAGG